jgi:hypothetical protein
VHLTCAFNTPSGPLPFLYSSETSGVIILVLFYFSNLVILTLSPKEQGNQSTLYKNEGKRRKVETRLGIRNKNLNVG